MANKVPVTSTLTLPLDREVHIRYKFFAEPSGPIGPIEGILGGKSGVVAVATLHRPRMKQEVTV